MKLTVKLQLNEVSNFYPLYFCLAQAFASTYASKKAFQKMLSLFNSCMFNSDLCLERDCISSAAEIVTFLLIEAPSSYFCGGSCLPHGLTNCCESFFQQHHFLIQLVHIEACYKVVTCLLKLLVKNSVHCAALPHRTASFCSASTARSYKVQSKHLGKQKQAVLLIVHHMTKYWNYIITRGCYN